MGAASRVRECRPLSQLLQKPQETQALWGFLTSLNQTSFFMLPWAQGPTPRFKSPKTVVQGSPVQSEGAQLLHHQYWWSRSPLPAP